MSQYLEEKEITNPVAPDPKTPIMTNLQNNSSIASFNFILNIFDFFTKDIERLQPRT